MFPWYTHSSAVPMTKFKAPDQAKHKDLGASHLVPAHHEPIVEFSGNPQAD